LNNNYNHLGHFFYEKWHKVVVMITAPLSTPLYPGALEFDENEIKELEFRSPAYATGQTRTGKWNH
jgi:hypothetical protein